MNYKAVKQFFIILHLYIYVDLITLLYVRGNLYNLDIYKKPLVKGP